MRGYAIALSRARKRYEQGLPPFKKKFKSRHPKGYGLISTSVAGTCYDDDYFLWHTYMVDLNKRHLEKQHEHKATKQS